MLQCYALTCDRSVTAFWRPLEVRARGKGPARPTQRPALPPANINHDASNLYQVSLKEAACPWELVSSSTSSADVLCCAMRSTSRDPPRTSTSERVSATQITCLRGEIHGAFRINFSQNTSRHGMRYPTQS
jgi:hypothetical protein